MIGVLLITHGTIGEALLSSAGQILGAPPARTAAIGVALERASAAAARLDAGDGVLVLTDMFGATPCNVAGRLLQDGRIEGVSGLSLPMLVRVLSGRTGSLADAVSRARSGGSEGVVHINRDRCGAPR
jgi:PTS system mannose-specific IIA component